MLEYINCSIKDTRDLCQELAKQIQKSGFSPEVIIYIADGGFIIGHELSTILGIPYFGIKVKRKGNKIKKKLKFLIKVLPTFLKNFLRSWELKSGIHSKAATREIIYDHDIVKLDYEKILIVDDSVDTGNSVLALINWISENTKNNKTEIKVASINVFTSQDLVKVDYHNYRNSIITFPWSVDSAEYNIFEELLNKHKS